MGSNSRQKRMPSIGTRALVKAYLLTAISGGGVGFLAVLHLDRQAFLEALTLYQYWVIVASAIGGVIALYLAGEKIGSSSHVSIVQRVAGSIWFMFVGALVGGTLALPLYGTMFGPFVVAVTLIGSPFIVLICVCNMIAINMLMSSYRSERETMSEIAEAI